MSDIITVRESAGDPSGAPIFVVGMLRFGSKLVEQILANHPAIEGTMKLTVLPGIVRKLCGLGLDPAIGAYPLTIARFSSEQLAAIGARYLRHAARWRQTDQPFFVDELPSNFAAIGLIRLILPNARIVDVRRHPLDCGLSLFRRYFP